ncbi:hypothetical protein [Sphingopyxis sp. LK2115]|jgi:hypothetical protein|uniref:hypothetical protein n=1 Tax=Sphingopyxis sp. LK2115 TaxID=2744558 RepID=UPI0016601ED1|nr:hypothetical protein [Sphingopyxis sp. LK2115]
MTQPSEADADTLLAAILAPPDRPGDRGFVQRIDRSIDAQAAYKRARGRFWRSFVFEVAAAGALLAALWLLSSAPLLAPLAGPGEWKLAPPLLLVLLLWLGTQRWRQA